MNFNKLSTRIFGMLLVFFLMALTAISLTLFISWQLEGSAAAINDAGSQRMRTYRMAYLLSQATPTPMAALELRAQILKEAGTFDEVMTDLEKGDPDRPLFLPKESSIALLLVQMRQEWTGTMRPEIMGLVDLPAEERANRMLPFRTSVEKFVSLVNRLVVEVEISSARSTALLRLLQLGLVILAVLGTGLLFAFLVVLVIRPVEELRGGIRRMTDADFSVRLPIRRDDEFGELGNGFNQMADRLEDLYGKLEQRVAEKTRDLEDKHRELTALYEVAASLSQPAPMDVICRGVLDRIMLLLDAQAGVVRYSEDSTGQLRIGVHRNLSDAFLRDESVMPIGHCLCGRAASDGQPLACRIEPGAGHGEPMNCREREGFSSLVAIPITSKNQVLGVFNLFFYGERHLTDNEVRLLETVGQHLGVAIENQRLAERDREMAVYQERNLLAEDLHDSIAQSLAFLNLQAQMLQDSIRREDMAEAKAELARIREGIQESYDDVRELLVHFRTRVDAGADLPGAMASALEKFEGQTGITTHLDRGAPGPETSPQDNIQILHIVQESLSNARKHSGAKQVAVTVDLARERCIRIRDDGKGFDPAAHIDSETHLGLKIMRERAHRIGGRLDIESRPGAGTTVSLHLPKSA